MQLKTILLGVFVATTAFAGPKKLEPPSRPHGDIERLEPEWDLGNLDGHIKRQSVSVEKGSPGGEHKDDYCIGAPDMLHDARVCRHWMSLHDILINDVVNGVKLDDKARASVLKQIDHLEHLQVPDKRQLVPGTTGTTSPPASADAVQGQIEKLENILELGVGPSGVPVDEDVKAAVLEEIDHLMKQIVEIRMYESPLEDIIDKRQMRHLPFPVNTDSAMEEIGLGHEE